MKNILIAIILGFTAVLHAQNTISGTIKDSNGEALAGISVFVPHLHKSTATDDAGSYKLNNIPLGAVQLIFSGIGYITVNRTVQVEPGATYDIIMLPNVHAMDEVIISTAFNRLQSENVMKVTHAGIATLRQQGVVTLIDGLALIPGVSQISTGASIGKPVIRGLSGNRVLVYTQGVRLENQQFGGEHGLGLNDAGIESVEVIKGPASLLYGSDALGGVLYFNPEKFADAGTITADFGQQFYSNTLGSNSVLGVKGSAQNWKFLGRASHATHSDYAVSGGDRVTNTRFNETDLKAAAGYSSSDYSGILRYNFNKLDLGLPEDGIGAQSSSKSTGFPKQGVDNHIISLHNSFFLKNSHIDADLGYVFNDRSEFEDSDVAVLHMKLRTISYNLKYYFPKTGRFETIAGLQGMYQTNTNRGEELLIPDAATTDIGVFATTAYGWDTGDLQAGLRFDNRAISSENHGIETEPGYFEGLSRSFDSFNASLGYKAKPFTDLVVRINAASGFRAPNLAELTSNGVHEGTNRYEIGNPDLGNEQNIQLDLNIEYKGSHVELFANGFYNTIEDYIFVSPTGDMIEDNEVYTYIQDDAHLYGGEAGIHFHPHPFDWLHIESAYQTVIGKISDGSSLPLIPANSWSNTIRTSFAIKKWLSDGFARFNVTTTFAQQHVGDFETASDGYTLMNAGIGGHLRFGGTHFELNLTASNLLDKRYTAHLSRLKADGIPNMGRNVMLGLIFRI